MYDLDRKMMNRLTDKLTETMRIHQTPLMLLVTVALLPQLKVRMTEK